MVNCNCSALVRFVWVQLQIVTKCAAPGSALLHLCMSTLEQACTTRNFVGTDNGSVTRVFPSDYIPWA